jgi:hypothetical protein
MGSCAGVEWAVDEYDVLVADAGGEQLLTRKHRAVALGGDENGGMDCFMAQAPQAELLGSVLTIVLNAYGFGLHERVRGFTDGERLELGRHTLRFLETPHVHHWDSMMLLEESTRRLFPSAYTFNLATSRQWPTRTCRCRWSSCIAAPEYLLMRILCVRSRVGLRNSPPSGSTRCTGRRSKARRFTTTRPPCASTNLPTTAYCWDGLSLPAQTLLPQPPV